MAVHGLLNRRRLVANRRRRSPADPLTTDQAVHWQGPAVSASGGIFFFLVRHEGHPQSPGRRRLPWSGPALVPPPLPRPSHVPPSGHSDSVVTPAAGHRGPGTTGRNGAARAARHRLHRRLREGPAHAGSRASAPDPVPRPILRLLITAPESGHSR